MTRSDPPVFREAGKFTREALPWLCLCHCTSVFHIGTFSGLVLACSAQINFLWSLGWLAELHTEV